jgi:hypothetical protein
LAQAETALLVGSIVAVGTGTIVSAAPGMGTDSPLSSGKADENQCATDFLAIILFGSPASRGKAAKTGW